MDAAFETKLRDHCKEEKTDHDTYEALAVEAEHQGMYRAAGILRDIAHEECTHYLAIEHILEMTHLVG